MMQEVRCKKCRKLLFKTSETRGYLIFQRGGKTEKIDLPATEIEVKCDRCGEMNKVEA